MRKKRIILFTNTLILSVIFVSFLDHFIHNVNFQYNSINNNKNNDIINPIFIRNTNIKLSQGNYTNIRILSISNPGGEVAVEGSYHISFIRTDLLIRFSLIDLNNSYNRVIDNENQASISITYNKTSGLNEIGILNEFITFDNNTNTFYGSIETSTLLEPGNYSISIKMDLLGYETAFQKFHLKLLDKFTLNVSISKPIQLTAGERLPFIFIVGYTYKSEFFPIKREIITLEIYLNNKSIYYQFRKRTDNSGRMDITFLLPINSKDLSFEVTIPETYYHYNVNLTDNKVSVISYLDFVISFSFFFGLIISSIIIIILIFYKLIIPKKKKNKRNLEEYNLIFEDIFNINHLLIVYKVNKEIILNKSYSSEIKDAYMLVELKSCTFSINNVFDSQNIIKEINYKDNIFLTAEGKFLFIGLILKKKSSTFFKTKLNEVLNYIEILYKNEFLSSNIKSIPFKEIEEIFENQTNISMVLPHRIELDKFDAPLLTKSQSIILYEIINEKIKENKKNSFYLSDIFSKFLKQTGKGILDFLMGITELRDTSKIMVI